MPRITMLVASLFSFLFYLGAPPRQSLAGRSAAATSPQLGQVNFPTSCAAEAQLLIETGVALLHSFQYQQADQTFSDAAKRDSKCAMAYWGKAMSHYQQLWEFPSGKALKLGAQDIQRAQKLGASSERERGYIAAAAAFYRHDSKLTHEQRMRAYSTALVQLGKQFPDDVNALAFYALSLMVLSDEEDGAAKKKADTEEAIAILKPLCEQAPNNPGPAHYLIHATDTPEFAAQGLGAARSYAKIAPDSAHALHMPSHIFVRLGLWQESINSNIASAAAAAKATNEHHGEAHYQFHALDFLHYSYLQSGQEAKAREVLAEVQNVPGASREDTEDHIGYMTARTALELHRWKDAVSLSIPHVRPAYQESTYRVRAIGAARSGDAKSARKNLEKYEELFAALQKEWSHKGYKATRDKSAAQLEAEAWVQYAEGKSDEAVKTMRAAAEKEESDNLDSLAVPAREMLGDLLLELKRPADAFAEYQTALKDSPNRFDSLYGTAHSAHLAGNSAAARTYFAKLMEISAPSADRAELGEAKSFLTRASTGN